MLKLTWIPIDTEYVSVDEKKKPAYIHTNVLDYSSLVLYVFIFIVINTNQTKTKVKIGVFSVFVPVLLFSYMTIRKEGQS